MNLGAPSPWLLRTGPARARLRLICFPHAGAGASTFMRFAAWLPAQVEVCAFQAPGRESRLREPPITDLAQLVDRALEHTRGIRRDDFALLGHSMGGLVAFEFARALRRRGERAPRALFLSGCGAPSRSVVPVAGRAPTDEELLAWLRRCEGTPAGVLADAELCALVLPTLRADLALREGYVCAEEPPLDLPLGVFGGEDDREVPLDELADWRAFTAGRFQLTAVPGGHFFFRTAPARFFAALCPQLEALLASSSPPTEEGDARDRLAV